MFNASTIDPLSAAHKSAASPISSGARAGIGVAGFVVLVVVILGGLMWRRRQQKNRANLTSAAPYFPTFPPPPPHFLPTMQQTEMQPVYQHQYAPVFQPAGQPVIQRSLARHTPFAEPNTQNPAAGIPQQDLHTSEAIIATGSTPADVTVPSGNVGPSLNAGPSSHSVSITSDNHKTMQPTLPPVAPPSYADVQHDILSEVGSDSRSVPVVVVASDVKNPKWVDVDDQ
ncbi:hypothetical protein HDU88_008005 [Geranomyces variabilis]|nr:hypothetical protein HDU88_008005 [Geranomyces variabilis]